VTGGEITKHLQDIAIDGLIFDTAIFH